MIGLSECACSLAQNSSHAAGSRSILEPCGQALIKRAEAHFAMLLIADFLSGTPGIASMHWRHLSFHSEPNVKRGFDEMLQGPGVCLPANYLSRAEAYMSHSRRGKIHVEIRSISFMRKPSISLSAGWSWNLHARSPSTVLLLARRFLCSCQELRHCHAEICAGASVSRA